VTVRTLANDVVIGLMAVTFGALNVPSL